MLIIEQINVCHVAKCLLECALYKDMCSQIVWLTGSSLVCLKTGHVTMTLTEQTMLIRGGVVHGCILVTDSGP